MKAEIIPSVSHVRRACGRDKKVVVRCRKGVVDMYPKPETRNPNTAEQQRTRAAFEENTAKWVDLPAEVKAGWNAFAAARGRAFGRESAEPLSGYQLHKSAAFFRKLLGLGDPPAAPVGMPPPPPVRVELLPATEGDTLRLRLEHQLKGGSFSVVVSMTPPTRRPSRKPDVRNKRYVKGLNGASTALLPAGGGAGGGEEVVFTGCRFSVAPGERFGVWVRIIRHADGLASRELALDFIRPEPEEGAGDADPVGDAEPVGEEGAVRLKTSGAPEASGAPGGAGVSDVRNERGTEDVGEKQGAPVCTGGAGGRRTAQGPPHGRGLRGPGRFSSRRPGISPGQSPRRSRAGGWRDAGCRDSSVFPPGRTGRVNTFPAPFGMAVTRSGGAGNGGAGNRGLFSRGGTSAPPPLTWQLHAFCGGPVKAAPATLCGRGAKVGS